MFDSVNRREFLQAAGSSAIVATASSPVLGNIQPRRQRSVIQLCLVGGPSQIDTWDPKPRAPENIRGEFSAIATRTPGVHLSECFPRMARIADRFSLVRSMTHPYAPIHETGLQLAQTSAAYFDDPEVPHFGAVASKLLGSPAGSPAWVGLPGPIGNTGVALPKGQTAGHLGPHSEVVWFRDLVRSRQADRGVLETAANWRVESKADAEVVECRELPAKVRRAFDLKAEDAATRQRYGNDRFGQCCLVARRLVEAGVRVVTINMFKAVFRCLSWDMHANGRDLRVGMDHYRQLVCPMFDVAYSALIEDLHQRGLLDDVLVVASGEFGRTPRINPRGGRDHWVGVWTALFAGGGTRGGRVVGASDEQGAYPAERPVDAGELVATVYRSLGVDGDSVHRLLGGSPLPEPIHELF